MTAPAYTTFENCQFPVSEGSPENEQTRLQELGKARKRQRKLLKHIRNAAASGAPEKLATARHCAMKSKAFLLVSAVDAEKKRPVGERHPIAELMGAAAKLSWYHLPQELVTVRAKAKHGGGFRAYCDFGFRLRTIHEALRTIYAPSLVPAPFQYDAGGNGNAGVPHAIRDIRLAIEAGYVWAATLDICQFFQNFTIDGIVELTQLDKKVVTNYALGTHLDFQPCASPYVINAEIIYQARQGAPQGSAFSSQLAMLTVSQLSWDSNTLLFNWVDDFLLLGKSEHEVESAAIALISKVGDLPGGHFTLKKRQAAHAADGFEFLGHRLTLNGTLGIAPARPEELTAALALMDGRVCRFLYGDRRKSPNAKSKALALVKDAWLLITCWEQAFRECDQDVITEHAEFARAMLAEHFSALGVTSVEIEAHSNPDVNWGVHSS